MKRLAAAALVIVMLAGCDGNDGTLNRTMGLRAKLLAGNGCSFDAVVTADYGDGNSDFSVSCTADEQGNLEFTVSEPETISGITGSVSNDGGKLIFDDTALAFELLADGQVTPVSAPWLLVKTLREGYITSCGMDGSLLRASIDDSYGENALHLDIWLGEDDAPVRAEILYKERRIVSLDIKSFQIL